MSLASYLSLNINKDNMKSSSTNTKLDNSTNNLHKTISESKIFAEPTIGLPISRYAPKMRCFQINCFISNLLYLKFKSYNILKW